jgi:hypothetical protein
MPFINVIVFYAPASNALALFNQANDVYFLPEPHFFHSPPPPQASS